MTERGATLSTFSRTRSTILFAGVIVAVVLAAAVGCASGDTDDRAVSPVNSLNASVPSNTANPPSAAATNVAADVRIGEFVTECPLSHRSPNDPLVHPHHDGASLPSAHSHDFFGNTTTDEHSTIASLLASESTTCDLAEDYSSYWTPTLYRQGVIVEAEQFAAYYDSAPGADPSTLAALPAGLSMIAGNDSRPGAVPAASVGWGCGKKRELQPEPRNCQFPAPLTLHILFPDCWNGQDVDSADHRSHVAYSDSGACPVTHPVAIVRVILSIRYPIYGDVSDVTLASGPLTTAHADFMNAWTERAMNQFTDLCIRRRVVCSVA